MQPADCARRVAGAVSASRRDIPAITLALLLLATTLAFWPAFGADFVRWDDQKYVQENRRLEDGAGLRAVWDPRAHALEQYYPLLFTSYWLEYRLWGLNARGYHATNVVLHLLNVCLVLMLLLRFGVSRPVAYFAAGLFALHPVQVASVAWIAERKNTLSAPFYLIAFLLYLRHRRTGAWWAYGLCVASFGAALLVKTQILTLPLSLCFADWVLQRTGALPQLAPRALAVRLGPLLGVAALAAVGTMYFEQMPWTPTLTPAERVLIPANAVWFYLAAFLAPLWPAPIHPQWQIDANDMQWWFAPLALLVGAALLVRFHRRLDAFAVWGWAHFYLILLPVLGVVAFNYMTYTYVADHFLYLAVIGGGLALAAQVERLVAKSSGTRRRFVALASVLLLAACGVRTYAEARHWRTNESFWRHVRDQDPDGFLGNYNLANHFARQAEWAAAATFYLQASDARPRVAYPFRAYAEAVMRASGPQAVINGCNAKLARTPNFSGAYLERGIAYEQLGRLAEASADYDRAARLAKPNSEVRKRAHDRRAALHRGG